MFVELIKQRYYFHFGDIMSSFVLVFGVCKFNPSPIAYFLKPTIAYCYQKKFYLYPNFLYTQKYWQVL